MLLGLGQLTGGAVGWGQFWLAINRGLSVRLPGLPHSMMLNTGKSLLASQCEDTVHRGKESMVAGV